MERFFDRFKSANKQKILIRILLFVSLVVIIFFLIKYKIFLSLHQEWLNVHLVPHSHDDVGWLKTPEDYFETSVRHILDNTVQELNKNPFRKFVYAETYFFWKWWKNQTESIQNVVKKLIGSKQLEIVGGGYCMSDEAVTYYQSFIDQSTWGFRFLNDTFGEIAHPNVGWQIDTFGHSKGIASLLAQMGFDSLFFARVDLQDRKFRQGKKLMEFVWWGNENLGSSSSIFTSIFYNHYSAPKGFDFESQSVDSKIDYPGFACYVREQSKAYRTNNILVPMGDDFRYQNAKKYFQKMDQLIGYFQNNTRYKLNVFYSTPSVYVSYLKNADLLWPDKHGDFFPYAAELYAYWTGFFTSRPTLKYFERMGNNFLQISKQLLAMADKGMEYFEGLTTLREAVGVLQHHDAITGTSQQSVADHYAKLLQDGMHDCAEAVDEALWNLTTVNKEAFPRSKYESCLLLNISACDLTEKRRRFVVTVYNSLSRQVSHYVRVPVTWKSFTVLTGDGTEVPNQLVAIPKSVIHIPGRRSHAKAELVFKAVNVPALGFKSFYVRQNANPDGFRRKSKSGEKSGNLKAVFNTRSGKLSGFKTKSGNLSVTQTIKLYKSLRNWSGAYLFGTTGASFYVGDKVTTKLLNSGPLVKEYEQVFASWATQVIRVYQNEDFVEFDWLIGPVPVDDFIGKEIVAAYESELNSRNVYFTDVNGMFMQKRIRNGKGGIEKAFKPIAGNYYPVTTMISIQDENREMYVIVDRPQGGGSLKSGQVELMIHRRLVYDDGRGVTEPLNEFAHGTGLVVRGRHWLLFGNRSVQMEQKAKLFSQKTHSEPWLFFTDASSMSFKIWKSQFVTEFSGIVDYVPRNVRILTLEPWREDTVLLRLEHVFEKISTSSLRDAPVKICLKNLFKNFEIVEARETALGADRWLSDVERFKWRSGEAEMDADKRSADEEEPVNDLMVSLRPQEIKTFIVKISVRSR